MLWLSSSDKQKIKHLKTLLFWPYHGGGGGGGGGVLALPSHGAKPWEGWSRLLTKTLMHYCCSAPNANHPNPLGSSLDD